MPHPKSRRIAVRPRQERSHAAKERILKAALTEFAEHGYERSTTRSIGKRARENPAMIRYYFGGKESLWKATMDRHFSVFTSRMAESMGAIATHPPDQVVRLALRQLVIASAAFPEQLRILASEGRHKSKRLRWLAQTYIRPSYEAFKAALEIGAAAGHLEPFPPEHLFYAIIGAAGLIFTAEGEFETVTGASGFGTPKFVDTHADLLIRFFLPALVRSRARRK